MSKRIESKKKIILMKHDFSYGIKRCGSQGSLVFLNPIRITIYKTKLTLNI